MTPDLAPELDHGAVRAACLERGAAAAPGHRSLLIRTIDRLEPSRWALEWHLPWWLGLAHGLDASTARELVISDVLGLAAFRLRDDLLDGDVHPDEEASARALAAALLAEALRPYRERFDVGHPFWASVDGWIADRHAATGESQSGALVAADPMSTRDLGVRGTPLKVPALAVCLLAGREDLFAALERCLDHALAALVLYDHLCDWEDDLAGGRWNALVSSVARSSGSPLPGERGRAGVIAAMMAWGAAGQLVERMAAEMREAVSVSHALESAPLTGWLHEAAARLEDQGRAVDAYYRGLGDRAAMVFFGAGVPSAVGATVHHASPGPATS